MNILLCGPYPYVDEEIWGGVESVLQNLQLGFQCYEPTFSVKILSGNKQVKQNYEVSSSITYIKQPRVSLGSVFLSLYPYRIRNIFHHLKSDVINAHSIDFGYYGLDQREKLIFTLHGILWDEIQFMPRRKQFGYRLFYQKKLDKILKHLKYLVLINPYVKKMVENKTTATVFDICNPIPDELFQVQNLQDEKRIFYLGVISRRKNLLTLIKSLNIVKKEIKNFSLIIAGKILDTDYFDEINDYINKNNLKDNVTYLGQINKKQKYEEYSKMNVLVLPSLYETAPMVISEAFAAGKPVLASNVCGHPYMIESGKNGFLVNPLDEQDMANKILYFFNNSATTDAMGVHAKKYALENHSLKIVIKKYKAAYEEVLSYL